MAYCIAKANKAFTTGEELILSASMDICREVLRKAAAKNITQLSLSARTVSRRIENVAGDIEAQLLERIVKSPWFAIQCDILLVLTTRQHYLFMCDIFIKRIFMRKCYAHCCCQTIPQPMKYSNL